MARKINDRFAARSVQNLVIIEAPGKVGALTAALRRGGLQDFHIIATRGHLYEMPEALRPVGIDRGLTEVRRSPRRPEIINSIAAWAQKAAAVLVATDADQEGDVLAWDIAQLLPNHEGLRRVRLRALDADSVAHAFTHPEPIRVRDAWPGTARRMLDRLVGAAFTNLHDGTLELSVGRVQSAILGSCVEKLPMGEAVLALPACDERDPFMSVVPLYADNRKELDELVGRCRDFARLGKCVKLGKVSPLPPVKPWNYGQAVLSVADATELPIDEVAQSMQRLYEAGRMSYPRASARTVTAEGLSTLGRIATEHGVRFDASRLPVFTRTARHAHESPRPLNPQVNLSTALLMLSPDDATLSLIARHLISCGQPHVLHTPDPSSLPAWARDLGFARKASKWLRPWPRKAAQPEIRQYRTEDVILRLLLKHRLGRPSTMVAHATRFAARQLLDDHMQMTAKGREWVERTPGGLLDARTSARIEAMIDATADLGDAAQPPAALVRGILDSLGLWATVEPLLEGVGPSAQKARSSAPAREARWPSGLEPPGGGLG